MSNEVFIRMTRNVNERQISVVTASGDRYESRFGKVSIEMTPMPNGCHALSIGMELSHQTPSMLVYQLLETLLGSDDPRHWQGVYVGVRDPQDGDPQRFSLRKVPLDDGDRS